MSNETFNDNGDMVFADSNEQYEAEIGDNVNGNVAADSGKENSAFYQNLRPTGKTQEQGEEELHESLDSDRARFGRNSNYGEYVDIARRACQEYGDESFFDLLESTQIGNEPAFVKFMNRVAKAAGLRDTTKPKYPQSEEMYKYSESVEGRQARAHFASKKDRTSETDGYCPKCPKSPEQYKVGIDQESVRARRYFKNRGYKGYQSEEQIAAMEI